MSLFIIISLLLLLVGYILYKYKYSSTSSSDNVNNVSNNSDNPNVVVPNNIPSVIPPKFPPTSITDNAPSFPPNIPSEKTVLPNGVIMLLYPEINYTGSPLSVYEYNKFVQFALSNTYPNFGRNFYYKSFKIVPGTTIGLQSNYSGNKDNSPPLTLTDNVSNIDSWIKSFQNSPIGGSLGIKYWDYNAGKNPWDGQGIEFYISVISSNPPPVLTPILVLYDGKNYTGNATIIKNDNLEKFIMFASQNGTCPDNKTFIYQSLQTYPNSTLQFQSISSGNSEYSPKVTIVSGNIPDIDAWIKMSPNEVSSGSLGISYYDPLNTWCHNKINYFLSVLSIPSSPTTPSPIIALYPDINYKGTPTYLYTKNAFYVFMKQSNLCTDGQTFLYKSLQVNPGASIQLNSRSGGNTKLSPSVIIQDGNIPNIDLWIKSFPVSNTAGSLGILYWDPVKNNNPWCGSEMTFSLAVV